MPTFSSIQPVTPTLSRALDATVTLAVHMIGKSFPAQLLNPYRRIPNDFELLSKANVIIDANGTDSQSEKTVREYMISTLLPSIIDFRNTFHNSSKPSLIVSDDHSNRVSIHLLEFFNRNNIIILCLPSHFSHLIQPYDRGLNKLLKHLLSYYCDDDTNLFGIFFISYNLFMVILLPLLTDFHHNL